MLKGYWLGPHIRRAYALLIKGNCKEIYPSYKVDGTRGEYIENVDKIAVAT